MPSTIYDRRHISVWLAAAPTIFIGCFVVAPVLNIFVSSVHIESLNLLRTDAIRNILWFTTWQAIICTMFVLAIALPLAALMANFKFATQRTVLSLISMPFLLPSVVVGVAFIQLLPGNTHQTAFALILAHVYFNFGFAVRLISARWVQIHPYIDDAARTLGASPFRLFITITLPLLGKAIANSAVVVFTFCFTSYGVVRVLAGPSRSTLETEIYFRAMQLGDVSGAMVLSALQVIVISAIFVLTTTLNRKIFDHTTSPTISRQKSLRTKRQKAIVLPAIYFATAFATTPVVALALRSLFIDSDLSTAAWQQVFRDPEILRSISKTIIYATIAMTVATTVGILGACSVAYRHSRLHLISALTTLPIIVSAVSVGLGIIVTFDTGWFDWRGAQLMLPVAHALVALPLAMRMMTPVLEAIPDSLREASTMLGASPWHTWRNIDFKILRRATVSAAVISAAVSIGEFGASSFLSRRGTETLPVLITRLLTRPGEMLQTQAFVLATLLALSSIAMIWIIDAFADYMTRGISNA